MAAEGHTASQSGVGLEHESVQPWVPTQSLEPHPQTPYLISEPLFSEQVFMGVDLILLLALAPLVSSDLIVSKR